MIYLFIIVGALFVLAFGSIVRDLLRPQRPTPLLCPACSNEQDFERQSRRARCLRCGYIVLDAAGKTGPDPTWVPGDRR